MKQRRRKRLSVNAPIVPFFLSAVCGILLDAWFSPGLLFWRLVFGFSIIALFFFVSVTSVRHYFGPDGIPDGERKKDHDQFLNPSRFFNSFHSLIAVIRSKVLYGNLWAWIAIGSFFGCRHETLVNYYPDREIGRYVSEDGSPHSLELRINSTPYVFQSDESSRSLNGSPYVTRFVGDVLFVKNMEEWEPFTGRVAVTIDGKATFLGVGDKIRVTGRLAQPRKKANPYDLDTVQWYRSQRILTTLAITSVNNVEVIPENAYSTRISIARFFEKLRKKSGLILSEHLSPRNAAVARGMTLGFRNDVDENTNESFRKTGTIHLLSISGLHVALVAGAFIFILRRIGVPVAVVSIATITLTSFYFCLTDMQAPVIRASILIITLCVGSLIGRRGLALNTLAFAAMLILTINPCELFQLGAQLSFLATGVFLWLGGMSIREKADSNSFRRESINERRKEMKVAGQEDKSVWFWRRLAKQEKEEAVVKRSLFTICLTSVVWRFGKSLWKRAYTVTKASFYIWIVSSPLILRMTNLFTPIALIANPLIWLPASAALLLAFLLIFCGLVTSAFPNYMGSLTPFLGDLTDKSFTIFLGTLDCVASPAFGAFHVPAPKTWILWCFYVPLILWTLFPALRPQRLFLSTAFVLWCLVAASANMLHRTPLGNEHCLRVNIFSVGHGCAVLGVFSDGRTFLYDCGSISNSQRAAELVAKELWNSQETHIDVAIISHADYDHYGGISPLTELVTIDRLCVSPMMFLKEGTRLLELEEQLKEKEIPVETVVGGDSLEKYGFPELSVLHPVVEDPEELDAESNSNSLVVVADYWGRRIMLPGDLDASDAAFLSAPPIPIDVTLAPHHGGKSDNYKELLEWAEPKWIVISGGSFQRHSETENELRDAGYCLLNTYDDGLIQIEIQRPRRSSSSVHGKMTIRSYRTEKLYEYEGDDN